MSSPRVQKIFEAIPDQLRKLGKYDVNFRTAVIWQGRATAGTYAGKDVAVIDMSADPSAAYAANTKRIVIVAEPASDLNNTTAMKTQSHAGGHFLDGSVRFYVHAAEAAVITSASAAELEYAQFLGNVQTHLVGQLAAPTNFNFSVAGVEATVDTVNGEVSTVATTSLGWLLPYGMVYPGGV